MKRPRVAMGLLVTVILLLSAVMGMPALAQPTFTGDVEADFTGSSILIIDDIVGDVGMPGTPPGVSGWDMKELRLFYHAATDTMYVGINVQTIVGDADGDGDPSVTSLYLGFPSPPGLGGADIANLGDSETAAVYFDLNQDGTWDVIGGIAGTAGSSYSSFSVNNFTGPFFPPLNFGAPLAANTGTISPNPDATHPDLEFTITNWSTLPGHDTSAGFKVGAFLGSQQDAGIGEDSLEASFGPAINIVKKTNGTDNNSPTGPYVAVNGTVTWTYNVTNPGSENLTNIVVIDDNGTPGNLADDWSPTRIGGDDGDNILQTTEAWIYEANSTAAAGQYSNNATVTGDFDGFTVSDSDPDHYFGSGPCIHIEKSTNGEDADSPTGPYIPVGDPVTWVYNVTNCGSVNLTNIVVTDDNGTPGNLADDWSPTFIGGDDGDNILQTTEAWIYQANSTAIAGQYANNSTVMGTPPLGSNVTDDDPSHYFGFTACIHIEKSTNGEDADSPTGPYIPVGDPVTWVYNVTNCGSVNLTNIVVTDDNGTPGNLADDWSPTFIGGDDGDNILQTTEAWIYQASDNATAGQYANNSTVTGTPPEGPLVSDNDPSHYFGHAACIHIEKSTNGQDADVPKGPYIEVGSNVTWQYVVTNCGTMNLTDIVVTDDNGTSGNPGDDWHPTYISGDDGDNILQTTETWYYQASGNATSGQYANIGYVTGTPPIGGNVSDSDPSHYYNRPTTVGWETYPTNKVRVLLPWIGLLGAIIAGAGVLVLRRRRLI